MVHWSTAFSLLMTSRVVMAAQDSAYYPSGWQNPLVAEEDMYYREAINVLQDLYDGKFSALYIKYHGCVWSEYGNGEDDEDGCGGDGGDEHWYMGRTQCYRANAAYSLYGVKSGSTAPSNPCSKNHYINSFFTNFGVEGFAFPLGIDYEDYGATGYCSNDMEEADDDGDEDHDHNEQEYASSSSYTTGCSSKGEFVSATFQGAFCAGSYHIASVDNLETFNDEMNELSCYQIHGGGSNTDDDDYDFEDENAAVGLLSYSSVCDHAQYPDTCPDPYGIKRKRDNRLYNSIKKRYRLINPIWPVLSSLFFIVGLVLLYLTYKMESRSKIGMSYFSSAIGGLVSFIKKSTILPFLSSLLFIGALVSLFISYKIAHQSHSVMSTVSSAIVGLVSFFLFFIGGMVLLLFTCKVMSARPQKQTDDPMEDFVRDESSQDQPIMERVLKSFERSVSAISQRGQSIKDKITAYAEELEDDIEPKIDDYQSPEVNIIVNVVEKGDDEDHFSFIDSMGGGCGTLSCDEMEPDEMEPHIEDYESDEVKVTENVVEEGKLTENDVEEESHADSEKPDEEAVVVDNEELAKAMMAQLPPEQALAIAKAMMAEKGIAWAPEKKVKKFKRPRLAKLSKMIFRKSKNEVLGISMITSELGRRFGRVVGNTARGARDEYRKRELVVGNAARGALDEYRKRRELQEDRAWDEYRKRRELREEAGETQD